MPPPELRLIRGTRGRGQARVGKTRTMMIFGIAVLGLIVLAVAALTAVGERRRGGRILLAVVAGVCFPVTWVVWYVRDQRPFQRAHS
jgi:hypothetical protein